MDFKGRVHFVGIGGAGMSAIAAVLLARGVEVSGSDLKESRNTERLREMGARVFIGHDPRNVEGAGVVVVSSAVPERNRELQEARRRGIPVLPRAAMLARIMEEGKGIAVAGTHGKTTTTSMVAMILSRAGLDPTYVVGGELNDVGSNAHAGSGEFVVAEADESDGSFLLLKPWAAVVTNVEEDHLDYYREPGRIREHFEHFVGLVPLDGILVVGGDDPGARSLKKRGPARTYTFGEGEDCDYRFSNLRVFRGGSSFSVSFRGRRLGELRLRIPGRHNAYNALAALALTHAMGVDFRTAAEALSSFQGVRRRFQVVDEIAGIRIVDDYAHHPSEVRSTLEAASLEERERIVCLFQPHRYSRTSALWRDFGTAFKRAHLLVLTDVYAAGEDPMPGVDGKLILNAVLEEEPSKQVVYVPRRAALGEATVRFLRPGDLVITMGAGDISLCAREISSLLRERDDGGAREGCDA
ncbi:UDP-N-acetylmuramate--L-alanine ligase [Candidatus Solincola sp.]|nr:UDP-N-acetylmuramate--L-alanine ligase [Actinomycetota bacterium]MDI7251345.1 UDP-N-acetylmuramate--L-alanine ligase [Actinomycetota bacterium]